MRRVLTLSVLVLSSFVVLAGTAVAAEVAVTNDGFSPEELQVQAGETIVWTNSGDDTVSLVSEDPEWESGPLEPGATFSLVLEGEGTTSYTTEDGSFTGGITVLAAAGGGGNDDDGQSAGAGVPRLPETGVAAGSLLAGAVLLLGLGTALNRLGARTAG